MKYMAFYFPQFHTTPENSRWWGEGFTDWQLVKKAQPLHDGHYQPRQPLNENYYDLADEQVVAWQASLAEQYGLHGFNFYHYWFNGKLMLEKPMEAFRDNQDHQLSYCITWANETWTRQWVGDPEVLLQQSYSADKSQWIIHFNYLLSFFQDERYKKVDNKPVFCIYRPELHSYLEGYIDCWDQLAKEQGFEGIHWVAIKSYPMVNETSIYRLFDAVIKFQPRVFFNEQKSQRSTLWKCLQPVLRMLPEAIQIKLAHIKQARARATCFDYEQLWRSIIQDALNDAPPVLQSVAVDWDNTPRYGARSHYLQGASPEVFAAQLEKLTQVEQSKGNDLIFINAWNEWSESAYLEPDQRFGYGYLDVIRDLSRRYVEDSQAGQA